MTQRLLGQVFPIQLEWLGGRNTFQKNAFSVRNALICLEDMKESENIIPVMIEKQGDLISFRTGNEVHRKDFPIETISNVHFFPNEPSYAVLEIHQLNGPSRFEVVRAPPNEHLNHLQNFVYTGNFAYPTTQALTTDEPTPTPPVSDAYDAAETAQQMTNGVSTPDFQTEEGYEEVAVKLADEGLNEPMSPEPLSQEMQLEVEGKGELGVEEIGETRSSVSTTSVTSETHSNAVQKEETASVDLAQTETEQPDDESIEEPQQPYVIQATQERRFGKPRLLADIIAEERINVKHYRDDGKIYVVSDRTPKLLKSRCMSSDAVESDDITPTNYSIPVQRIPSTNRYESVEYDGYYSRGRVITPRPVACKKCPPKTESKMKKIRSESPAMEIRMRSSAQRDASCSGEDKTSGIFYFSRHTCHSKHEKPISSCL